MSKNIDFNNLFSIESITYDDIVNFTEISKITLSRLINALFKYTLNVPNHMYNSQNVYKAISMLSLISINRTFTEDEIVKYKDLIKKSRTQLLQSLVNKEDKNIRNACNKLDEIVLSKSVNEKVIIKIIKELIDRKEDISIIKKVLGINKQAITSEDNALFDYVFNKTISSLDNNNRFITYYITLLKIFYSSSIDTNKYLVILSNYEENVFTNNIKLILQGIKRITDQSQIKEKYEKDDEPPEFKINNPNNNLTTLTNIFSIDSSKCDIMDDALSIKKDGNKYIVGIHVADVAKGIDYESDADITARNLFKNSYFKRDRLNIFDTKSSKSMSLVKDQRRSCITLFVVMNDSGDILDYFISNDDIIVADNLSYLTANSIIDGKKAHELKNNIEVLFSLSKALREKSKEKEKYWEAKEANKSYKRSYKSKSNLLVGEFSILYNKLLALEAKNKNYPFIYRVQDKPYIKSLLEENNIDLDAYTNIIVSSIFENAYSSTIPMYHYGLKENVYSQCSSPLRRYTDIYNQRLIHKYMLNNLDFDDSNIEDMVKYLNEREFETRLFDEEYQRACLIKTKKRN